MKYQHEKKFHRGPKARRKIRRKVAQGPRPPKRVLFAGKPKKKKSKRYQAPSWYKWRP